LGPFTAKNFATSIAPWIVSLDALEPFRCCSSAGPVQNDPAPLPYLVDPTYDRDAYDVKLEVAILPPGETTPSPITRSNFRHMYWNMKQQLVHHSVSGCPMVPGDLLGSGTISGTDETAFGSMLELSWRGAKDIPLVNSPNNETRKFIKDGDTVIITGYSQSADGSYRIGFGEVSGLILPAGTVSSKPTIPGVVKKANHAGYSNFKLYSYYRSTSSWRVRIALALKGIHFETIPIDLSKVTLTALPLTSCPHLSLSSLISSLQLVGNTTESLPLEFRELNPLSQVPVLEFTNAAGEVIRLTQSMAILDFLEEIAPNPSIYPADPLAKARAKQVAEIINSGIQPLQNLAILRQVRRLSLPPPPPAACRHASLHSQVKSVDLIVDGEAASGCDHHTDGRGFAKCNIEKGLETLEGLVASLGGGVNGLFAAGTGTPTVADMLLIPQLYNAVRFNIDLARYPSSSRSLLLPL
jgi:glutathione S-transferase